jgi:hypothetical protein
MALTRTLVDEIKRYFREWHLGSGHEYPHNSAKGDTGATGPAGPAGTTLHSALTDVTAGQHHAEASASGAHTVASQVITAVAATDALAAHVELATLAELEAGTDTGRVVTPDALAGSNFGERIIGILVSDPGGDAITTGDGKVYARIPSSLTGMDLVAVAASVSTVSSSGAVTVMVRRSRRSSATARTNADMLSVSLTIDVSEFDSIDAATAATINTANDDVVTGDHIHIDIDGAGTGAKGLYVELIFKLP